MQMTSAPKAGTAQACQSDDDSHGVSLKPLSVYRWRRLCGGDEGAYWWRIPCCGEESREFSQVFTAKYGMTPQRCFRLLLLNEMLWISSATLGMLAGVEYARYYITNDLNWLNRIDVICFTPLALTRAFLYPFFGGIMDRLSRKHVLVPANIANALQALLLAVVPSIPVLLGCRLLGIIGGVQWIGTFATMRDLFPKSMWEQEEGGYTHILAQISFLGNIVTGCSGAVGLGLLLLIGNEYQERKEQCSSRYCVQPGQFSWNSSWGVDGGLRVVALLAAASAVCAASIIIFLMPETLPLEFTEARAFSDYAQQKWRELGRPWRALRVFSTRQTRCLLAADFVIMIAASALYENFLSWYRRANPSNSDMAFLAAAAAVGAVTTLNLVKCFVNRCGDMRGVWVSANLLVLLFVMSVVSVASAPWPVMFPVMLFFNGPGFALWGCKDGLFSKLFPPEVQATWRTGRNFLSNLVYGTCRWPFAFLFEISESWDDPWNMLTVIISAVLLSIALCINLYTACTLDPKKAIDQGDALVAFFSSSYAKGPEYEKHLSRRKAADATNLSVNGQSLQASFAKASEIMEQSPANVVAPGTALQCVIGNTSPKSTMMSL